MTNRRRWQRGNALIEGGLAIPALFILFAGVADFGRSFWGFNEAVSAARDGAQVVINDYPAYTASTNDGTITTAVQGDSNMSGLAGTVSRFYTCPNTSGDDSSSSQYSTPQACTGERIYVKVVASAPFTSVTPHPMITYPSTVKGTTIIRVQ